MASYLAALLLHNCYGPGTIQPPHEQPKQIPNEVDPTPTKCRYILDDSTSTTLTLPDGRQLGYAQYGAQAGRTIFYLHGIPGSRIEGAYFDSIGKQAGARIISIDRPGIGWSSPHPGRTVLDHVGDLEQLAEHLKLKEYGVIGVSGGGPYALACAQAMPADKLKAVAVVCGLGPPDMTMAGAGWENWLGWTFAYPYVPSFPSWYLRRQIIGQLHIPDDERFEIMRAQFYKSNPPARDLEAISKDEDLFRVTLRASREYFGQKVDGVAQDGHLLSTDFGFRIEDIRKDLPIGLWYGKYDKNVPLNHGIQTAKRVGGSAKLHVEDETHTSIFLNLRDRVIEELLESWEA